mgnify:CR=1 FL=1
MSAAPAAIETEQLVLKRGARAVLNGVDFQLQCEERVAIAGRSGCGKTTFLRVLAGLERAESGRVRVAGSLASDGTREILAPWQRGLQLVFQDLGLWPTRTVLQNVSDVCRFRHSKNPREESQELLERLGLGAYAARLPGTLSGGEARRLAFARALAAQPRILLLDEPFSSLDPEGRLEGFNLLNEALRASPAAVVLVSHDPEEAAMLGGRRLHMVDGVLKE